MAGLDEGVAGGGRVAAYSEDATGFGAVEWRTARDMLVRPRDVLLAYVTRGSTGGGHYARPLRFYVALCGLLTFYLFLVGGADDYLLQMPETALNDFVARSGKTRETFINDADEWLNIATTPILCAMYALALAPVIKNGRTAIGAARFAPRSPCWVPGRSRWCCLGRFPTLSPSRGGRR